MVVVCGFALTYTLFRLFGWSIDDLKYWLNYCTDQIRTWPAIPFFVAVALLPLIGFPISPLFIAAGVKFGVAWAIPFSLAALAVNLVIAHWISTKLLHGFIQRMAQNWNYTIPRISRKKAAKWVLVVRISGAPLAMQNYILGLGNAPFWPYLLVSLAVQSVFVILTIVLGEAILSGHFEKAFWGLGLLVIAFLTVSYLRTRYGQSKSGSAHTSGG